MLRGGNALTVGVGIIIEVIRKNNSDYDPDMGTEANAVPSSRDPIYLGTLLRLFAQNVPKFMSLIMDAPAQKDNINSTFGEKLEPLGFDRFKTCELMAELLHCSNMGLLNEPGSEEIIAARDAERQRLRTEGKLAPLKEEDASMDDLTMRRPHASPEEGRRLEVTNADDDGFEEVEPSKEMSEDTSHEFVKAEDDMPPAPGSSLLGKDEDDFVDEPLSSPRLAVGADKITEQQFEEPDLVVAPLSPSKTKPAELSTDPKKEQHEAGSKAVAEAPKQETPTKEDTSDSSVVYTPTTSEPESKTGVPETPAPNKDIDLSPHPEDLPAPLFSAPPAPESGADRPPHTTAEKPADAPTADAPDKANAEKRQSVEDSSRLLADQSADQTLPAEPVVGDYLKMQFVEYRVVPTILVSSLLLVACQFSDHLVILFQIPLEQLLAQRRLRYCSASI